MQNLNKNFFKIMKKILLQNKNIKKKPSFGDVQWIVISVKGFKENS